MANTVKFGLSKAYYSVYNESTKEYGTPVALPGAVSLTITAEGDESTFYADNNAYFTQNVNAGYSGNLEVAQMPKQAYIDLLGSVVDKNGVLVEGSEDKQKTFALLYEVKGNENDQRFAFYNCTLSRPDSSANTAKETIDPDTDTMKIRMIPRVISWGTGTDTKNLVKASVTNETATKTQYDAWYTTVYMPEKASA